MTTRRVFLQTALAAAAMPARLDADPLGLPAGLQLYSVREQLAADYHGTLQQLAALGYRQVEAAGFFNHRAQEVKLAMEQAGLACVSAHYVAADLYTKLDEILDFAQQLGLHYLVCSFPAIKNPGRLADRSYEAVSRSFLAEDWHYNAEQFNRIGARIQHAGMHFAYHNHTVEFRADGGVTPFDILLEKTDPALVSFELDCGWVVVGGGDPAKILLRHGSRIAMLHLKDFKRFAVSGPTRDAIPAELGRGRLNNARIVAAAHSASVRHVFVEQEAFDVPWLDSLRIDRAWLRRRV